MSNSKHNWKLYKARFITHPECNLTLSDFAKEIGVRRQLVSVEAKKSNWIAEREAQNDVVETKLMSNLTAYEVDRRTKMAKKATDIAEKWLNIMDESVDENGENERISSLKTKEVRDLIDIADKLSGGNFKKGNVNINIDMEMGEMSDEKLIEVTEMDGDEYGAK